MSGCDGCACSVPTGGVGAEGGGCCSGPSSIAAPSATLGMRASTAHTPTTQSFHHKAPTSLSGMSVPAPPGPSGRRQASVSFYPARASRSTRPSHMAKHGAAAASRTSLSSRVLIFLLAAYVLSLLLMMLVPESQGLLVYAHWLRLPFFKDLTDLVSFRIPHGRNIQIATPDGMLLKGWHLLPASEMADAAIALQSSGQAWEDFFNEALRRDGARVVIYFHGNAATRGQWNRVELVKTLSATLGCHVIAVDYRGFADSTGWPSEEGLATDARSVWDWVYERTARGHVSSSTNENDAQAEGQEQGASGSFERSAGPASPAHIYLYGHSLGSGVAVKLASHLEDAKGRVAPPTGVILDAPFTNLTAAALHHPSALPFRLLPFVRHFLIKTMKNGFPSIDLVGRVSMPLLVLHGRNDRMIPFHLGQELYQAAKLSRLHSAPHLLEDLWFSDFATAGHNDVYAFPQWVRDVSAFMTAMERPSSHHAQQQCTQGKAA